MTVDGEVRHDWITIDNGTKRIVKVEWEVYWGAGSYAQWSLERVDHADGSDIVLCERHEHAESVRTMRAEDARELMLQLKRFFPDWADRQP